MPILSQIEREAKVRAVQEVVNEELWTMGTPKFNTKMIAERILRTVEQVEIDFDERYYEISRANAD